MSLESVEVVVRGHRAFIDRDFDAIADLLDPNVEWYSRDAGPYSFVDHADVLGVVQSGTAKNEHTAKSIQVKEVSRSQRRPFFKIMVPKSERPAAIADSSTSLSL